MVKLRTQLITVFLLIGIIPMLAVSLLAINANKNSMEEQIRSHLETAAQSKANHVKHFLETHKEAIEQISKSIIIKKLFLADKNDKDYTQKFNDVMQRLKDTAKVRGYTYGLFVLDKQGKIIASNEELEIGKDQSQDLYFLGGKKGVFVKDAYVSQDKKINTLAFSAPILSDNNEFLGIVAVRIATKEYNNSLLEKTGLGKTGEIYLINREGYMITPSRFLQDTFLKQKIDTENSRNCFRAEKYPLKHAREHKAHEEPILFKDYRGVKVLGTHVYIPEMRWCLLAEIDEKEVFAPIKTISIKITILTLLFAILIAFTALIYSGYLAKPIKTLTKQITEITKGKLNIKLGKSKIFEIKGLIDSLNRILASLKLAILKVGVTKGEIGLGEAIKAKKEAEGIAEKRTEQLAKFARLSIGREEKMIALKRRINEILKKHGKKPEFKIPTEKEAEAITSKYIKEQKIIRELAEKAKKGEKLTKEELQKLKKNKIETAKSENLKNKENKTGKTKDTKKETKLKKKMSKKEKKKLKKKDSGKKETKLKGKSKKLKKDKEPEEEVEEQNPEQIPEEETIKKETTEEVEEQTPEEDKEQSEKEIPKKSFIKTKSITAKKNMKILKPKKVKKKIKLKKDRKSKSKKIKKNKIKTKKNEKSKKQKKSLKNKT